MSRNPAEIARLVSLAALVTLAGCGGPTGAPDASIDGSADPDGSQPTDGGAPRGCEGGCLVEGVCYPDGVADPTNPCQACDAAASSTAFPPRDGGACDDGSFCTVGDTCSAGVCTGTVRSCDDGIACNGTETCDEDADACNAGTPTCASGELCDAVGGACIAACPGCAIGGVCYGDGQVDPLNPCQKCDAGASRSDWTANDGASCDDGAFCTVGEVCSGGTCGGGAPRECSDGVACNGVETCDEAADACVAGVATCGAAEICDVASDSCTATCTGCVIGGVCFGAGQLNPDNACEVCAPATSTSSFSPNDGARCDDGLFCTTGDVCIGTVCGGTARDCSDGVTCNGAETCDETAGVCAAGSPTCASGTLCDPASDACVTTCSGCVIGGVCYADGTANPGNPCQVCDVATSASSWSDDDGARCDDGLFCTTGDVCAAGVCAGSATNFCDDGIACNGAETCNEDADRCVSGASTCASGQVCDPAADSCVTTCSGCVIGGVCYADGTANPGNPCQVCDVATSASSWSDDDGARCDDGLFCTTGDVCAAGVCAGSATNFCDDGIACNGAETCDEAMDRCRAGTTSCTGGQVCDGASDRCVLRCAGGTTLCGATCVQIDSDPRNCGGCGEVCSAPSGADPVCIAGGCSAVCTDGFADCDGDPTTACARLADDEQHCGACGNACAAGETCLAGVCEPPHLVFITSEVFDPADFGSLATADAHCQRLADAADLPGTYKAWLSDSSASPSTRFTRASVPYVRVDGVKVADDWSDLTDSSLDAPISVNEAGGGLPASDVPALCLVVTGTKMNGAADPFSRTCEDWTVTRSTFLAGDPTMTNYNWTDSCQGSCVFQLALYCFQQ